MTVKRKVIIVHIHMPKRRPARRSYHHGDLRRALIDAALDAIAEEGVASFTLRDVARRVGVSPAAPYRHFPDKDALIAAIAAECTARLGAAMDEAMAAAGDDPVARFRASGVAYVRFAVANPQMFRALGVASVVEHVPEEVKVARAQHDSAMRAGLERAQRAGRLAGGDLAVVELAARALLHGLAWILVEGDHDLGEPMTPERAGALALEVTELFGKGLRGAAKR